MYDEKVKYLEEKVQHLEFKLELLFHESNTNRLLFEYNITKKQYNEIMDLMDQIREKIEKNIPVNHSEYESRISEITKKDGDYHFAEYMARAFWEDERWENVFPKLYGEFPKYKHIINEKDKR